MNFNTIKILYRTYVLLMLFSMIFMISPSQESEQGQKISNFEQNMCGYQIKKSTLNKVALTIPTYIRAKDGSDLTSGINYFKQFLDRLVHMECDAFQNIYFIWNNRDSPEQLGVLQNKQKWKKNVFFIQTSENTLDFRFLTPKWMEQQLLLSVDDDQRFDCEVVKNAIQQWNEQSIGDLGPILTNAGRGVTYQVNQDKFKYIFIHDKISFTNFATIGGALIPRHFMQLYYSNFYELRKIRETGYEVRNCDDMAMNFISSLFYSQLPPVVLKGKSIINDEPKIAVSSRPHHHQNRDNCIDQFARIVGKNPLIWTMYIDSYQQKLKRQYPMNNLKCLSLYKKYLIEKHYLSHKEYYLRIQYVYAYLINKQSKDKYQEIIQKQNKFLNLTAQHKQDLINLKFIDPSYKSRSPYYHYFQALDNLTVSKLSKSRSDTQTDTSKQETKQESWNHRQQQLKNEILKVMTDTHNQQKQKIKLKDNLKLAQQYLSSLKFYLILTIIAIFVGIIYIRHLWINLKKDKSQSSQSSYHFVSRQDNKIEEVQNSIDSDYK